MVFLFYIKLDEQRERITKLTRIIAIQQAETESLILNSTKKVKNPVAKVKKKAKKKK